MFHRLEALEANGTPRVPAPARPAATRGRRPAGAHRHRREAGSDQPGVRRDRRRAAGAGSQAADRARRSGRADDGGAGRRRRAAACSASRSRPSRPTGSRCSRSRWRGGSATVASCPRRWPSWPSPPKDPGSGGAFIYTVDGPGGSGCTASAATAATTTAIPSATSSWTRREPPRSRDAADPLRDQGRHVASALEVEPWLSLGGRARRPDRAGGGDGRAAHPLRATRRSSVRRRREDQQDHAAHPIWPMADYPLRQAGEMSPPRRSGAADGVRPSSCRRRRCLRTCDRLRVRRRRSDPGS